MRATIIAIATTVVTACAGPRAASRAADEEVPKAVIEEKSAATTAYTQQCREQLEDAKKRFEELEARKAPYELDQVLGAFNELLMVIDRGANRAGLYSRVHPDAGVREVGDSCEQDFQKIVTNIGLSRPLYGAISTLDLSETDAVTRRYVGHLLRDFRRAGVDKPDDVLQRIRILNEELVRIGQEFGRNIREDVRSVSFDSAAALEGLPPDYIDGHAADERGKVTITTDYPDYLPFMSYAKSDAARLAIYTEFRKRGHPTNIEVLDRMLAKRYELARLLGYDNWAQYVTEDKMIKTADAARTFIEQIASVSRERAQRDYAQLLSRLKREIPDTETVGDWQKGYLENLIKREDYQVDSQHVRQFFTYDKVRDGLFAITSKLFGIAFVKVEAPVWHDDVEVFEITDGGKTIGRFFLDMHPRDAKFKHAAAFPLVTGVRDQQQPEATLVCNFPADGPMEHKQVETFFHEFGHLLHHLLGGEHRWVGISGFNTEWDFVEAPSQMLEEWAWDAQTLRTFATNEAGEPIPEELVASMRRARDFGKGVTVAHQMFYASVSLGFYDRDPNGLDTTTLMKSLQERYSPFGYVEDTYFHLSFGHLDGYSAIYYTYMWSLVIAKDLFSRFEEAGMLNTEVAMSYRKQILGPGGSKDAAHMIEAFLGREYTFDSFARWLNRD